MNQSQREHGVLFVTYTVARVGPNISLLELVTRLPDHLRPIVATPGDGPVCDELERRGVENVKLDRLDKWGIADLTRLIRRERISLVYGNSASGVSRNALIAARLAGRPFICHLREMAHRTTWTHRVLGFSDAIIAVSHSAGKSYSSFDERKVNVVYNGVSLERFAHVDVEAGDRIRREWGVSQGDGVIVSVGNVCPRKGQLKAIDVYSEASRTRPATHLVLAGRHDRDPAYVERVRAAIARAERPDHIHLLGLRTDVPEILSAADVFLHTADADPHPRAVIEAMAAGLPVVAFDVDGVGESVVEGETGHLVSGVTDTHDLAHHVLALLDDEELRKGQGEAGRRRANELFSARGTAGSIARIIGETMGG